VHENLLATSLWRLFPKGFYRVEQAKRATRELIASAYRAERLGSANQGNPSLVNGRSRAAVAIYGRWSAPSRRIQMSAPHQTAVLRVQNMSVASPDPPSRHGHSRHG
jgi:hypothetical protein